MENVQPNLITHKEVCRRAGACVVEEEEGAANIDPLDKSDGSLLQRKQ